MYKSCMYTQGDGKTKKAGLIETREGMGGGYRIAKVNSEITLRQISDALENTLVKSILAFRKPG